MGRFFYGSASVPLARVRARCPRSRRAPSLRPRLRRCLHVASTSPQCGSEAKRCFASHWGGFRHQRPKLRFGFSPPPSLGEGGLRLAPSWRELSAQPTEGVRAACRQKEATRLGWLRCFGGATRNRTGVDGFAGRCITTLPSRQSEPRILAQPQSKRNQWRAHARVRQGALRSGERAFWVPWRCGAFF